MADLTLKEWVEKYQPVMGNDGEPCPFETYDFDIKYVNAQDNHNVWTLISCDGDEAIISGKHFVNRILYYITKNKWENFEEVILESNWEDDDDIDIFYTM